MRATALPVPTSPPPIGAAEDEGECAPRAGDRFRDRQTGADPCAPKRAADAADDCQHGRKRDRSAAVGRGHENQSADGAGHEAGDAAADRSRRPPGSRDSCRTA